MSFDNHFLFTQQNVSEVIPIYLHNLGIEDSPYLRLGIRLFDVSALVGRCRIGSRKKNALVGTSDRAGNLRRWMLNSGDTNSPPKSCLRCRPDPEMTDT